VKFTTKPDPPEGTTRIVKGFLFFPKHLNGQTRWLEIATWKKEAIYYQGTSIIFWKDTEWVDD